MLRDTGECTVGILFFHTNAGYQIKIFKLVLRLQAGFKTLFGHMGCYLL